MWAIRLEAKVDVALARQGDRLDRHGDVIDEPKVKIDEYLKHRRARERQIVKALRDGPLRITEIVERVYASTPPELQEWAGRQVHAHLLKLKAEGTVEGGSVKSAWKLA